MMLAIPDFLDAAQLARVREIIDAGHWQDGNATSGHQSALAKKNRQLPEESPQAKDAGRIILEALGKSPLFVAAALPLKIFPPLFNRYEGGEGFGTHVDNAVRIHRSSEFRVRSDLSATLFLEPPEAYEGG
jgi:PKHD-type hydroxylase